MIEQKFSAGSLSPSTPIGAGAMGLIDTLLRDRRQFFEEVQRGQALPQKIRAMLLTSFVSLALYGLLLGSTHSLWQSASSALKLPLLFLATLFICTPVLYILNILFGANQRLSQSIILVLSAISLTAILLLSFAPITLFFVMTVPDAYQFFKLLNVFFFTISGIIGANCLEQGLRIVWGGQGESGGSTAAQNLMLLLWMMVYAFVGSQVAWTLRPFVGYPDAEFELLRQVGGNFYTDILASMGEIFGFIIVK